MTVKMVKNAQGFSLVELITVIIIIGIIAVTAAPQLIGRGQTDEILVQKQLLTLLSQAQQRAMQDVVRDCYGIALSANQIASQHCAETMPAGQAIALQDDLTLTITSGLANANTGFLFNASGCPVSLNHASVPEPCGSAAVQIDIVGETTRHICVQSQGYIRSGQCA